MKTKTFRPCSFLAASLALGLVGQALAAEPQMKVLEEGGPTYVHAIHSQNPLVQAFKSAYPRRVHLTVEDTEEQFTLLNEGPRFEIAQGHYGTPNMSYVFPKEELENIYKMVSSGELPPGKAKVDMVILMREFTELNLRLPPHMDKAPKGPGPAFSKGQGFFMKLMAKKYSSFEHMTKASEYKEKGSKVKYLYHGLLMKIGFKAVDKMKAKAVGALMRELGRDLEANQTSIQKGGAWDSFIDVLCFYALVKSPQHMGDVLSDLQKRVKSLSLYHGNLPPNQTVEGRKAFLESRLELLDSLVEMLSA